MNGDIQGRGMGRQRRGNPPTLCVCPQCGYETDKTPAVPCRELKCPKCGIMMIGK